MAGIRHHYLPRFLQRGFASKVVITTGGKEQVYTWVSRKEGRIFESKTENVSVQNFFYGREGDLTVDPEITEIEKGFAFLIKNLRQQNHGYKILTSAIAEFVGHLSARTKHLRDSLIDTTNIVSNGIFGHLSNQQNYNAWSRKYYERHPEVISKALDEVVKELKVPKHQRAVIRERLRMKFRPSMITAAMENNPEYALMFGLLNQMILEKLPELVKESHIKALAKSLIAEPRVDDYRSLNWFVYKPVKTLILGDMGCFFEGDGKKRFRSIIGKDENISNIYLPISTNTLIVGTVSDSLQTIDIKIINEAAAKCSRDYFISSENSVEIQELTKIIGEDSDFIDNEDIKGIVDELICNDS